MSRPWTNWEVPIPGPDLVGRLRRAWHARLIVARSRVRARDAECLRLLFELRIGWCRSPDWSVSAARLERLGARARARLLGVSRSGRADALVIHGALSSWTEEFLAPGVRTARKAALLAGRIRDRRVRARHWLAACEDKNVVVALIAREVELFDRFGTSLAPREWIFKSPGVSRAESAAAADWGMVGVSPEGVRRLWEPVDLGDITVRVPRRRVESVVWGQSFTPTLSG